MLKYSASVKVTNTATGGVHLCVFIVSGEDYANAFAEAIDQAYIRYPESSYSQHECKLVLLSALSSGCEGCA